jgi:hypothetical protein
MFFYFTGSSSCSPLKPAVACSTTCQYYIQLVIFCQQCGYFRRIVSFPLKDSVFFDLLSIDNRLDQLQQQHLSNFRLFEVKTVFKTGIRVISVLVARKKTLFDTLPFDVCRFLVYNKDCGGKTQPTKTVVNTWVKGVSNHVVVRGVSHTVRQIRISENYVPSFRDAKENGTGRCY